MEIAVVPKKDSVAPKEKAHVDSREVAGMLDQVKPVVSVEENQPVMTQYWRHVLMPHCRCPSAAATPLSSMSHNRRTDEAPLWTTIRCCEHGVNT